MDLWNGDIVEEYTADESENGELAEQLTEIGISLRAAIVARKKAAKAMTPRVKAQLYRRTEEELQAVLTHAAVALSVASKAAQETEEAAEQRKRSADHGKQKNDGKEKQ